MQIVFKKAIEWGIIKDLNKNPTIGIKKFKEKVRDRFLEADELNINEGSRKWRVPEIKNGEALTIPLNDEAVEMLKARKEHQERR